MNRAVSRHPIAALVWLALSLSAYARPPVTFGNSNEAVKLYQESAIDALRERCTSLKSDALLDRPEVLAIRNGYVLVQDRPAEAGRYTVFVFDQDKRTFWMIDGQAMQRNLVVGLKLALPRDYARCRIVKGSNGQEQIEVVHTERNHPAYAVSIQRLMKEAAEIADLGQPASAAAAACAATSTRPWVPLNDRLLVGGKLVVWRVCHDVSTVLRERLARLVRKPHDL